MNISFPAACLVVAVCVACSDGATTSPTTGASGSSGGASSGGGSSGGASSGGASSGGTSGATYPSGLPTNKKLSEITDADMVAVCEASKTAPPPLTEAESKKAICALTAQFSTLGATTDAEAQAKCQASLDDCLAKPPSTQDTCGQFKVNPKWKTCQAPVSEYDACYSEQIVALKASVTFDCKSVKAGSVGSSTLSGAACTALEAKCPGSVDGV